MCLAVPRRVLRVEGDRVEVDGEGGPLWASAAGVSHLKCGEYVLVHAGLVLERVSDEEAEQILALQASLVDVFQDASPPDLSAEALS